MARNEYAFVTHWRVEASAEEVYDILAVPPDLVRWWPSVYLEVRELSPGDESGVGKSVSLWTKGWLPYILTWQLLVTQVERPRGFSIDASGDFNGHGVWTFEPDGEFTNITYEWNIRADKALLKYLSPLMKPVFSANHRWAMARGEASLVLEIARRHAATDEERAIVADPPAPTPNSLLPFLGSVLSPVVERAKHLLSG